MNEDHVAWCRNTFALVAEGGVWGVPRSGLLFQKLDGALILSSRMPHMPGMPGTAEEWAAYQDEDFESIREHFGEAGVPVFP